ncbi:MAG TPA: efflux RND transporter permease subunit, partial [Fredinandcohnia sp.]|nr:efflux RND transporter permease subunit [Fredinandcohnia sp.]
MNPIQVFIRRPVFTTMLLLSVVVFGLYAYPRIGVDSMPNVDFPVVTVTVIHPGADPESMERDVAEPIEEAINTISGLDKLRSISVDSVTQVIAMFDLDKDPDVAAQEVRDKVQSQINLLPPDIETPIIDKFDIGAVPIAYLALSGPVPIEELTRIAEDVVKPLLQQQSGVGQVEIQGGREREIRVEVDPDRLRGYGLAVSDVAAALAAQNLDVPGGRTKEPGRERTVKLTAQAKSVEEIRDIIIPAPTPAPVRVRDVANVIDGPEEARSIATFQGQSAVSLVVQKQSGANTTAVAEAVIGALPTIERQLPEGARIDVVYDGSRFIRASIDAVKEDLLVGGILAVLIVLLFLRNLRSTLVAAVALPTSVIGTFAFMKALDFTFNNVTMLALT